MIKNFVIAFVLIAVLSVGMSYLQGCKATQTNFVTLKTIIPYEDYSVYKYSSPGKRLSIKDSSNAHEFPDTIRLVRN